MGGGEGGYITDWGTCRLVVGTDEEGGYTREQADYQTESNKTVCSRVGIGALGVRQSNTGIGKANVQTEKTV